MYSLEPRPAPSLVCLWSVPRWRRSCVRFTISFRHKNRDFGFKIGEDRDFSMDNFLFEFHIYMDLYVFFPFIFYYFFNSMKWYHCPMICWKIASHEFLRCLAGEKVHRGEAIPRSGLAMQGLVNTKPSLMQKSWHILYCVLPYLIIGQLMQTSFSRNLLSMDDL